MQVSAIRGKKQLRYTKNKKWIFLNEKSMSILCYLLIAIPTSASKDHLQTQIDFSRSLGYYKHNCEANKPEGNI